jgi:hypothetical protein
MYKRSIISSLVPILLVIVLVYVASVRGKFSIIPSNLTGYTILPEFSTLSIFALLLALLALFMLFQKKHD